MRVSYVWKHEIGIAFSVVSNTGRSVTYTSYLVPGIVLSDEPQTSSRSFLGDWVYIAGHAFLFAFNTYHSSLHQTVDTVVAKILHTSVIKTSKERFSEASSLNT